ncbi:alpha-glucosidase [mine drainage metagenome]|uniref:Alpha-glucosidase n=1 Tax=mine drainage metagenome TaxID=410659 RepID=A0A1J5STV5_9ZZZZ
MNRRQFIALGAGALLAARTRGLGALAPEPSRAPAFTTANRRWQSAYDQALAVLAGNVRILPRYPEPVLIEGSVYKGIWMECGPHEALVYRKFRPDVARNSHLVFFALQHADGQLPANNKVSETGFGQIQMVVPIAATAWELARATRDEELLHTAYASCSRWDAWLERHRMTRGAGLVEGFCTYDTGNDNSPRWAGLPNQCPHADARLCPPISSLPRLCPDLSATTYGGRIALAAMAHALGQNSEADRWTERADALRKAILAKLYSPEDGAFYDLDAHDRFVRIRSEIITRVCGEHVPDQALFDSLWARQIHNPEAFWAPYPFPSVALDDPRFVRPIPRNSWGGAAQALTALRAGRWLDHYGRPAEFAQMMDRWCEAIQCDMSFRQQLDPLTGAFTQADAPGYSPCALVMMDYTWRLAGIHEEPGGIHWNIRPGHPASDAARFRLPTDAGPEAALDYDARGARLSLGGRPVGRIDSGTVRLVTDTQGRPLALVGVASSPQSIELRLAGLPPRTLAVHANERISLQG